MPALLVRIIRACCVIIAVVALSLLSGVQIANAQGDENAVQLYLDSPSNHSSTQDLQIEGWVLDQSAGPGNGPGIQLILVYKGDQCEGELLGETRPSIPRPDVVEAYGLDSTYLTSGFSIRPDLAAGPVTFTVCAQSTSSEGFQAWATRQVTVVEHRVTAYVDAPAEDAIVSLPFTIAGWAIDANQQQKHGSIEAVRVYANNACEGKVLGEAVPSIPRPDVAEAFALSTDDPYYGFQIEIEETANRGAVTFSVCAYSDSTSSKPAQVIKRYIVKEAKLSLPAGITISSAVVMLLVSVMAAGNWHAIRGSINSGSWHTMLTRERFVLPLLLGLFPVYAVLVLIDQYAVNVPLGDEWVMVIDSLVLEHLPRLELGQLWQLENEHRVFIPRVISLTINHLTGANQVVFLYINVGIAFGFGLILYLLFNSLSETKRSGYLLLPFVLLLFSLTQWPRWIDTRPFYLFLAILGFLLGLWAIFTLPRGWRGFWFAAATSYLSSLSFFTGNFTWVVLGIALWLAGYRRLKYYLLWGLMASSVWVPYLYDFSRRNTIAGSTEAPGLIEFVRYLVVFIGAPITRASGGVSEAQLLGTLGVGAAILLFGINARFVQGGSRKSAPWVLLTGWVLLNGAAAAYGRIETFGMANAREIRYRIYGLLFWVAIVALLTITLTEPKGDSSHRSLARKLLLTYGPLLLIAIIGFSFVGAVTARLSAGNLNLYTQAMTELEDCMYTFDGTTPCPNHVMPASHPLFQTSFLLAQYPNYRITFMPNVSRLYLSPDLASQIVCKDTLQCRDPQTDQFETEVIAISNELERVVRLTNPVQLWWPLHIPSKFETHLFTGLVASGQAEPTEVLFTVWLKKMPGGNRQILYQASLTLTEQPQVERIQLDLTQFQNDATPTPFEEKDWSWIGFSIEPNGGDLKDIGWLQPYLVYEEPD